MWCSLTNPGAPLTLIQVLVPICCLYFRAKLVPQAMQLPLQRFQARDCGLEKAWLNDADVDSKVVQISPERDESESEMLPMFRSSLHQQSYLRQSEKPSTANLEMQYPPPFAATLPSTEATLTIRPRAFLMRGRKVMVMAITPLMLTLSVRWKSSTLIHSEGPMGNELPALFTSPQSP